MRLDYSLPCLHKLHQSANVGITDADLKIYPHLKFIVTKGSCKDLNSNTLVPLPNTSNLQPRLERPEYDHHSSTCLHIIWLVLVKVFYFLFFGSFLNGLQWKICSFYLENDLYFITGGSFFVLWISKWSCEETIWTYMALIQRSCNCVKHVLDADIFVMLGHMLNCGDWLLPPQPRTPQNLRSFEIIFLFI